MDWSLEDRNFVNKLRIHGPNRSRLMTITRGIINGDRSNHKPFFNENRTALRSPWLAGCLHLRSGSRAFGWFLRVRGGSDGDMESGAYGAAKAGGSFDLRRFLTQPQVVVRAVSLVSRRGRRGAPHLGPGAGGASPRARQVAAAEGRGGGGARGVGERAAPRSPPPGPRARRSPPPSSGPRLGGRRRRPSPRWQWEELGVAPGQVAGSRECRLRLGEFTGKGLS